MTIEEAKEYIPDFDVFRRAVCDSCTANDWYCPSDCEALVKAKKLDYDRILKCYARNDGELWKVIRYIRQARI